MLIQDAEIFDKFVNKQQTQKENKSSFYDGKFIKFERGNTYKFRLLYTPPSEGSLRQRLNTGPFIELYNHGCKNEDGYYKSVVCPTTSGKSGWDKCPICKNNNVLWKSHEAGNSSDKALYDLFKRKFHGYALVYVVNDPTTEENNGKVRLMHYTKGCKDFFQREIFGESDDYDSIGVDAFRLAGGYDFCITVDEKSGYNNYTYRFANKPTDITADKDELETQLKELDFDGGKTIKTSIDESEVEKFYREIVLREDRSQSKVSVPKVEKPKVSDLDDVLSGINTTPAVEEEKKTTAPPAGDIDDDPELQALLASI